MVGTIARAQKWFEDSCAGAGHTLELLLKVFGRLLLLPRKKHELLQQLILCVLGSAPVVFIVALFTGMIVSFQTGVVLRDYGQEASLGYIMAVGFCREMGPVFTCLTLAGLVGSTYAAELGTMKVSEELDALEVMSIDPVYYLVMPRVLALAVAAVVLTIYADLIGVLGGAIMARAKFGVDIGIFLNTAEESLKMKDIYGGLFKSMIFGMTIAAVSCSHGLRAGQGPAGVGRATLRAVVISFIFILAFDYLISPMIW